IRDRNVTGVQTCALPISATIPMYAGELAEAKYRGVLSGLLQWMLSWGFLVAQWVGYGCSFVTSDFSCKFPKRPRLPLPPISPPRSEERRVGKQDRAGQRR